MRTFRFPDLVMEQRSAGQSWREFLRVPALSMGIYELKAGQLDQQKPHAEDEVYYVLTGAAKFRAGNQEIAVGPGSLIFVEKLEDHRFCDITDDLTVLVFFAPAEGGSA